MYRVLILCLLLTIFLTACGDKPATDTATGGKTEPAKTEPAKTAEVKHPWASYKVGSFAKLKSTSTIEVAGKPMTTTTEIKQTLVDLSAEKATLETETSVMGQSSKTKIDMPLKGNTDIPNMPSSAGNPNVKPKESQEDITVKGKTLKCKVFEVETEQAGNKIVAKTWTSDEVPGHMVKTVSKTTGTTNTETTSELVDFEAK